MLRNAILYNEDRLRETTILEAKISLEIARMVFESQSQEPENLMKGLGYCHFIWQSITEIGIIRYDEIDSSEKEIKSLENKIIQKLRASGALTEIKKVKKQEFSETFEIHPN